MIIFNGNMPVLRRDKTGNTYQAWDDFCGTTRYHLYCTYKQWDRLNAQTVSDKLARIKKCAKIIAQLKIDLKKAQASDVPDEKLIKRIKACIKDNAASIRSAKTFINKRNEEHKQRISAFGAEYQR